MKQIPLILFLAGCFSLLHSCDILALHPLAEGDDVLFDKAHLGIWKEQTDPEEFASFEKEALNQGITPEQIAHLKTAPTYEFIENGGHYSLIKTSYENVNDVWAFTSARFEMVLTQIDGNYWASFTQDADQLPPRSSTIALRSFLIQGNGMARVDFDGADMNIRFLKYNWFKTALKKNRMRIDYELVGTGDNPAIILTATTPQLRGLMAKIADEEDAFEEEYITLTKTQ